MAARELHSWGNRDETLICIVRSGGGIVIVDGGGINITISDGGGKRWKLSRLICFGGRRWVVHELQRPQLRRADADQLQRCKHGGGWWGWRRRRGRGSIATATSFLFHEDGCGGFHVLLVYVCG
jgi:hypothetical protein